MNGAISIIAAMAHRHAAVVDGTAEEKIKAAMWMARKENWMLAPDEECFRGALAGALEAIGADTEDGKKLLASCEALKKFSAFLTAAQAGLSVEPPTVPEEGATWPLMGWWHESKELAK